MSVAGPKPSKRSPACKLHLSRAGSGAPVLVLHHDIGTLDRLPFYDTLAKQFDVLVPHHPGWGKSERPQWLRHPRDIAAIYSWLLADLGVDRRVAWSGLGFGGWIAAEMASQSPRVLSPAGAGRRRWASSRPKATSPTRRSFPISTIRRPASTTRPRSPRSTAMSPPTSWRRGTSPRNVFPHRLETLHVQPDLAASAGRRAHARADHLGRRRPDRSDQRRPRLCQARCATRR